MGTPVYLWHRAYWAAICETNDELMPGRILQARSALEQRLLVSIGAETNRCGYSSLSKRAG
jgi:hypothetical protein